MGLFSRLFGFGSKSVVPEQRKVLLITESESGYPVITWQGKSVTVHSTVIDVNRLRVLLLQGVTLPIGWQSVSVSGNARIDNLFLLVNELAYTDYLRQSGNTIRLAEGVTVV